MKNHLLLIMRHAKSDRSDPAAADFERKLTDRGKRDAKKMGAWLKRQDLVPDKIICSPAARTKRTALIVCKETGFDPECIIADDRIYDASREELLEVVGAHMRKSDRALLIGHNPGLEDLLEHLSADEPEPNSAGKVMTTAAIAVLDYGKKPVCTRRASARLLCLSRPRG